MNDFTPGSNIPAEAHMRVDLKVLHEMLRLPKYVEIAGVRADPQDPYHCIVDLRGVLPVEGELIAEYTFQNTTVVTFKCFRVPEQ